MSEDAQSVEPTSVQAADPDMSLVEVSPGYAVLYGDSVPDGLELASFDMMQPHAQRALTDKLSVATGLSNVAIQGAQGLTNAQGLVRLAPETLHALQYGKPMTSGGWNLGSIVNAKGQTTASIRWAPATGAQSAAVLASLGPAAALLALQVQLASISRRVDENIELTRAVLQALHQGHWTTLLGLHETTMRAVREAQHIGAVTDHVYSAIATKESDLRKMRHVFQGYLSQHISGMNTDLKQQREYIQKHSEQMFADIHGVLMAEGAWYRSQTLRAGHIMNDEANTEQNSALLAELVEVTQREHQDSMEKISGLLETLERQCRLMAELPTGRSLPFSSKRQSAQEAAAMAEALAAKVAELRGVMKTVPDEVSPTVAVFEEESPQQALHVLRWVLRKDEPLLALASVTTERWINDSAYLGITPERCFITNQATLKKQGEIDQELPLHEVRYVRFKEHEKTGPVLDIITAKENVRVTFDNFAQEGEGLAGARRVGDLLATVMHVPEDERRADPLLTSLGTNSAVLQHSIPS